MSRENKSRFALLGILSKGEMSGYDIKQVIKKISKYYWSESNAQIYPLLKKLEAEGLVVSKLDKKSGARQRRIYSLTSSGFEVLKQWLMQSVEPAQYREELLLKLGLFQHLSVELRIKHIEEFYEQLLSQQKYLAWIEQHLMTDHKGRPDQSFLLLTHRYSEMTLQAKLNWCAYTLKQLKKQRSK